MRKILLALVLCCAAASVRAANLDNLPKLPRIYNYIHLAECLDAFRDREFFEWIYAYANYDRTPELQFMTGYLYHHGLGVERNYAEAAHWYRRAIESKYNFRPYLGKEADAALQELVDTGLYDPAAPPSTGPEAILEEQLAPRTAEDMRRLATQYFYGICAPLDHERSDLWEKRAAIQDKREAMQRLGEAVQSHRSGDAVDKEKVAEELLAAFKESKNEPSRRQSQQVQTLAEYAAEIYDEGRQSLDAGDYFTAALRFSEASGFGIEEPMCYFFLGDIQENGLCGLKNYYGAGKNYRLAAEMNHFESMSRLAALHEEGRGVRRSLEEAAKWYAAARDGGVAGAGDALTRVTRERAAGKPEDWQESPEYRQVLRDAQFRAYFNHSPFNLPDEMRSATSWLFRAAENGQPYAQYLAGMLLRSGDDKIDVPRDSERALMFLQQAADAGIAKAKEALEYQ